jgi:hypothetical protein
MRRLSKAVIAVMNKGKYVKPAFVLDGGEDNEVLWSRSGQYRTEGLLEMLPVHSFVC